MSRRPGSRIPRRALRTLTRPPFGYPFLLTGVFFLFGQGRLHLCRSQPAAALGFYRKAMEAQNQYRNLHHISFWEMAIANLALWEISASLECWRTLAAEATVRRSLTPVWFGTPKY